MTEITREELHAYLDDALTEADLSRIEQALRDSAELRTQLAQIREERDRGEHTLGAIWRRERLTCSSRDQLGTYLLGCLEPDLQAYVQFHLETIGCVYCRANLEDLRRLQAADPEAIERARRIYESTRQKLADRNE